MVIFADGSRRNLCLMFAMRFEGKFVKKLEVELEMKLVVNFKMKKIYF